MRVCVRKIWLPLPSCVVTRSGLITHYTCWRNLSPKPAHLLLGAADSRLESVPCRHTDRLHPPEDFRHLHLLSFTLSPLTPPHPQPLHTSFEMAEHPTTLCWTRVRFLALASERAVLVGFREHLQWVSWSVFSKLICHKAFHQECVLISGNGGEASGLVWYGCGRCPS